MNRPRLIPLLSAFAAALLISTAPARADEAQEISRIMKQGQQEKALERANSYLATHPKDAQVRFIKGLILTEQNKTGDAIKVFTSITDDYPELPEPYNNLAVLYASQGQYEKAKTALEMAINTHPSYATAHENLGDIYAKMASQAYDKALQLDKGNANAQSKLALIKDIFSKQGIRPTAKPAAMTSNAPAATAKPAPAPAPVLAPASAAVPAKTVAQAEPAKPLPATAAPIAAAKPVAEAVKPAAEKPAPDTKGNDNAAILATVEDWARAWSAKNVEAYLKFYAPDLVLAKGESRKNWEQTRRERISKPKSISVAIHSPEVKILDASNARITFKQHYRASSFNSETWKTLVMVKSNGKWLIHEERIGR
ncbi:MAG: tetratricopeptide repeat protein [Sulfurimicrobium sp.]|jgi:tetratricopeptide (TPR) repeat protein|nr:tetratricopeptide repeat protein [Sulfurimicrobium sp.]MDP1704755.1 tetratricopeptide repeat protein [Sulfurimicrobium sp.]MDP2197014.1 tetratricopeptide repeat protein [Sulfurimicrobium sp.]MDP3686495.1 tetratricopeptide repeat protein [Sulfurimicrobium sp.]MDZ7657599.1 tetratricopeptide repeat protein [Sulfurimicrobium sp.]